MKFIFIIIIGAGLWACSSVSYHSIKQEVVPVDSLITSDHLMDSFIAPFRLDLNAEMNRVLGYSRENLVKHRPNATLNNWVADALLSVRTEIGDTNALVISLLNYGGIRSSISKGPITVGNVYQLMPFDNQVVWVKMPKKSLTEIGAYLDQTGGEAIGGISYIQGEFIYDSLQFNQEYFWVLTSDYLFNGGDKMNFFHEEKEHVLSNLILRDVFINAVIDQDTLHLNADERILLKK
jgi:2',3'-cyclic-nucleotide 2'-phosphodiesterase (5'-nucleotidase family)